MSISHRVRYVAAWLVGLYLAQLYLRMGWGKFGGDGYWTAAFSAWGYPAWFRVLVGVIEVSAGIALLLPPLASYAALALAVVMMGAWSTLAHDLRWHDMAVVTVYGIMLGWIASVWWRVRFRRWQALEV
jgi:putative oxidoreductase